MLNVLTFKEVCNFIKKDDGELIDAANSLLGADILCSSIMLGPAALPALGLLKARDELTSLGKKLLSKITSKKESDYLARMRRMEIAYGLICYTAFFDALDRLLPNDLRKKIGCPPQEIINITEHVENCTIRRSYMQERYMSTEPEGPQV